MHACWAGQVGTAQRLETGWRAARFCIERSSCMACMFLEARFVQAFMHVMICSPEALPWYRQATGCADCREHEADSDAVQLSGCHPNKVCLSIVREYLFKTKHQTFLPGTTRSSCWRLSSMFQRQTARWISTWFVHGAALDCACFLKCMAQCSKGSRKICPRSLGLGSRLRLKNPKLQRH